MGNVLSISLDNLIVRCCDRTIGQIKYVSELEQNLRRLRTELTKLAEQRNDVQRRVEIAEGPQMKRLDRVRGWFVRVETMENEVNQLIAESTREIENKCFSGCCPKNCRSSYDVGKRMAIKLPDLVDLEREGHFDEVVERLRPAPAVERPSEPTVGLESILEIVWKRLIEEDGRVIGLYGLGGVGKTTLMKEINNKLASTDHHFDVVIWVVVSKNLNRGQIQNDIGKRIGLHSEIWEKKSQEEKALEIHEDLKRKRFVLFLDDIWEMIHLLELGVPRPDQNNRSKVVFTTRCTNVCGSMGAEKIEVKCLPWEEAWNLFKKTVGEKTLNSNQEISKLAETVAKECSGLPLALTVIGRAMASLTTSQEWKYAVHMLRESVAKLSGMGDEVFPRLHFSYEKLPSDMIRFCFLYCALYAEDSQINKIELINYWIGEKILDESSDVNGPRFQGHNVIGTLVRACLLEDISEEAVKVHDVLRDMALWIACDYGKKPKNFLVRANSQLTEAPKVIDWKGVEKMSLMRNYIEELIETPTCPELETLFLNDNPLKMIPSGFFQFMSALKVLDLSCTNIVELPLEVSEIIPLQYLNLSHTNIKQLPIEVRNLKNLVYLNLEFTLSLFIIPTQVIPNLTSLQVLRLRQCCPRAEENRDGVLSADIDALLEELNCLEHLNDLSITVEGISSLGRLTNSPKLRNGRSNMRW